MGYMKFPPLCGRIKTSKATMRRAGLGKGGGGGEKNAPARFSHFFLLNAFSPLSRSLEQANQANRMVSLWYHSLRMSSVV